MLISKVAVLEQTLILYGEGFAGALQALGDVGDSLYSLGPFYDKHRQRFIEKMRNWQQTFRSWADRERDRRPRSAESEEQTRSRARCAECTPGVAGYRPVPADARKPVLMRMTHPGRRLPAAACFALIIAGAAVGCTAATGREQAADYCAYMPDSVGLYVGNPVTQMGYRIGEVTKIADRTTDVQVELEIFRGRRATRCPRMSRL